jgi:hypothetical protein
MRKFSKIVKNTKTPDSLQKTPDTQDKKLADDCNLPVYYISPKPPVLQVDVGECSDLS